MEYQQSYEIASRKKIPKQMILITKRKQANTNQGLFILNAGESKFVVASTAVFPKAFIENLMTNCLYLFAKFLRTYNASNTVVSHSFFSQAISGVHQAASQVLSYVTSSDNLDTPAIDHFEDQLHAHYRFRRAVQCKD